MIAYDKPVTLQIFIGTDVGRVAPHMFYQACKVSGKNSTPCNEKKVEGTIVIEIDLKPDTEMTATCDCVGILKVKHSLILCSLIFLNGKLMHLTKNNQYFSYNFYYYFK